MWKYYDRLANWLEGLGTTDWFVLAFCVLAVGFVCMRGFGSRKSY